MQSLCPEKLISPPFFRFKGGGRVLEDQLLPLIVQRGPEFTTVTKVADGDTVDQMTPHDSDLLSQWQFLRMG